MKINSVNMKDKGTGVKVKQPTLLELKDLILGVEGRLSNRIDGVDSRLDRIDARLDGIDSRLDRIVKLNNLKD
jgi:hypothetical protein